jgi:SAM-dependent methyltransferase
MNDFRDENFNESYYLMNNQCGDRPALRFYCRLARKFFSQGKVLDFGSGTGHFLKRLSKHFPVEGFEISGFGRARTKELLPEIQIYKNIEEIPAAYYTGISALHVVEHIADDELLKILQVWKKVLTICGRVIVVTPDVGGKGCRIKGSDWIGFKDSSHQNLKAGGDWIRFFEQQGFDVVKTGTDGLWDFPYMKGCPKIVDAFINSLGTLIQFLSGRLLLKQGSGESIILVLQSKT